MGAAGRGVRAEPAAQVLIVAVDVVTEITIDRPRAEVAAYACEPDNATEWYANIETVQWRSPRPLAVGARLAFVARFLGRRLDYTYEVRELAPGERFVMSTEQGPFPMETTYAWEDAPGGATRMTLRNRAGRVRAGSGAGDGPGDAARQPRGPAPAEGDPRALGRQPAVEDVRDLGDVIELARRDPHHELIGVGIGRIELAAVLRAEHIRSEPCEPLVAIHERVVARERVQQRRRLARQVRIGILAEDARPWPMHGRVEQAEIAYLNRTADRTAGNSKGLLGREVARHSPSRRSSSENRCAPRSANRSVNSSSLARER